MAKPGRTPKKRPDGYIQPNRRRASPPSDDPLEMPSWMVSGCPKHLVPVRNVWKRTVKQAREGYWRASDQSAMLAFCVATAAYEALIRKERKDITAITDMTTLRRLEKLDKMQGIL